MDPNEKNVEGKLFEDKVAELLARMGFTAYRNKHLLGRSGQSHQVDFYFQSGGQEFVVECKSRFLREHILSIYGKITDLDIDHVFVVTRNLPFDMMEYSKRFNLTPIVLEKDLESERCFENIIKNRVHRTSLKNERIYLKQQPVAEISTFYLKTTEKLSSYFRTSFPSSLSKFEEITSFFPERITRLNFVGAHYQHSSYVRKQMKEKNLTGVSIKSDKEVTRLIDRLTDQEQAELIRFGIKTSFAYIVTNLRIRAHKITSDDVAQFLKEKNGEITSLTFRLHSRGTLYINQKPTLSVRYYGKKPEVYFELRELFEDSLFRGNQ
jgi:hypothetical protein